MVILFPDGTAIESSTIAALKMSEAEDNYPGRLQVYTFDASSTTAKHFATVNIGTNEEARVALKRLTAQWMGLPEL